METFKGEEHSLVYGGPVEGEEDEEPGYHVVVLNEEDEFDEIEDEAEILALQAEVAELALGSFALAAEAVERFALALTNLDDYEAAVEAQYEGQEEPEIEVGDLYLDLLGELYYEDDGVIGAGVSYAFGTIAEIDDEEEEPVIALDEETLIEERLAIELSLFGEDYSPTKFRDAEQNYYEWENAFSFADPTAEEE